MTLKSSAAKRISDTIYEDLSRELSNLREEYLKSKEFEKLVEEEKEKYDHYEAAVNLMLDSMTTEVPAGTSVSIGSYSFTYSEERDDFVNNTSDIINTIKWKIENNLGINYMYEKNTYLRTRILGIVCTFSSDISFLDAMSAVRNQVNLNEILFNKQI